MMSALRLLTLFFSIHIVVSIGNASSFCAQVFQANNTTAVFIQNLAEENLRKKIRTTGYESIEHMRLKIKEEGYYRNLSPEALATQFTAGLRAPENLRDLIASEGFKNQHQLNNRGHENLEKMVDAESGITGLSKEEFGQIPNRDKPMYAALVLRPEYSKGKNSNLDRYGDDLWIARKDVLDRSTWTATDSWSIKNDIMGLSWDKKEKSFEERDWTHIAKPSSALDLAIPFLDSRGVVNYPTRLRIRSSQGFFKGQIMPPKSGSIVNFIEFQIWGGLSITDISDFIFYKTPPTDEQLVKFKQLKIKVWDGRTAGTAILIQP